MIRILVVLVGCVGVSSPPGQPGPPAPGRRPMPEARVQPGSGSAFEMIVPEAGHPGLPEALGAAGACREDEVDKPPSLRRYRLESGPLLVVQCAMFAYQGSFELWREEPLQPWADAGGQPIRILGFPEVDVAGARIEWLAKARGPGDCGDWYRYELVNEAWTLREHRARSCDDESAPTSPPQWAVVPGP